MDSTPSEPTPPQPTPQPRLTICPYCGSRSRSLAACESCGGRFDPLSRQATQNAMGPWFVRFESQPFRPGCSYATLVQLIERGKVRPDSAVRGPTTKQFWVLARWCPGVAHRLGICHSCQAGVALGSGGCAACGVEFSAPEDRQVLGLGEVRDLPSRGASVVPVPRHSAGEHGEEESAAAHEGTVPLEDAFDIEQQRSFRLQRDLRKSRRWTRLWAGGASILILGIGGVFLARELDLEAGPLGGWLSGQGNEKPAPPGAEAAHVAPPSSDDDDAPLVEQAGVNEGSSYGLAANPSVEQPERADAVLQAEPEGPRLETFRQLRRLR